MPASVSPAQYQVVQINYNIINLIKFAFIYQVDEGPYSEDVFDRLNLKYRVCVEPVPKRFFRFLLKVIFICFNLNRDDHETCECNQKIGDHQRPKRKLNNKTTGSNQNEWSIGNNTETRSDPEHGVLFHDALVWKIY